MRERTDGLTRRELLRRSRTSPLARWPGQRWRGGRLREAGRSRSSRRASSPDDGSTWLPATLQPALGRYT